MSDATTLAPSPAHAMAKLPSPAATSSTSCPAETAQASARASAAGRSASDSSAYSPSPHIQRFRSLIAATSIERAYRQRRTASQACPAAVRISAVKVSAKSDYAVRALLELAQAGDGPIKGERVAQAQDIPLKFLENILIDLRHAGIVRSQRGADGGYWLARPADSITVGEAIRAVDGPL